MSKKMIMPLGPIMLDIEGQQLTDSDRVRLQHSLVGGVILFSRNYKNKQQVARLINEIKQLRTPELLIAVDQEGGRVQRFKEGFTLLPAANSFGKLWAQDKQTAPMRAFESAYTMANELIEVGVDFSFAPVFDLEIVNSEVIGDRSFDKDPDVAIELLGAYIDGMHTAGMIAVAKHFPGHGGVAGDSHHCLPEDSRSFEEIDSYDMKPYRELIDEINGVMTAHVIFSSCDSQIPSSSSYWIQTVLRNSLGFEGVVFSDDLSMAGATQASDNNIVESAKASLKAGCDMVLICNSPEKADELLAGLDHQASQQLSYKLNSLRANR